MGTLLYYSLKGESHTSAFITVVKRYHVTLWNKLLSFFFLFFIGIIQIIVVCLSVCLCSGAACSQGGKHCEDKKIKLLLCCTEHHAVKAYGWMEVLLHVFLILTLGGGGWLATRSDYFKLGWLGPRFVLDASERGTICCPYRESNCCSRSCST